MIDEFAILTQCYKFIHDRSTDAARYKPPKRNEQMEYLNVVKQSGKISKTSWLKFLTVPGEYSAYSNQFIQHSYKVQKDVIQTPWFDYGGAAKNPTWKDG